MFQKTGLILFSFICLSFHNLVQYYYVQVLILFLGGFRPYVLFVRIHSPDLLISVKGTQITVYKRLLIQFSGQAN